MIMYTNGNLFDCKVQTLVNPVNTVGVMGKGLALAFKNRYPDMFQEYKSQCDRGELSIGSLHLYKSSDYWILNFPTKKHWRNKSQIAFIKAGLKTFIDSYPSMGIDSIAFPKLGCGYGGLDWKNDVQPMMEQYLSDLPIQIEICLG